MSPYRTPASVPVTPEQWLQFGLKLGFTPDQLKKAVGKLTSSEGHAKPTDLPEVPEPPRARREEANVIYFSVISDGTTGEEWVKRLSSKGFRVSASAKQLLRSPRFLPTNGVATEVAVLKGPLFNDNDLVTSKIRAEAKKRQLLPPSVEVACLIREKFTDEELEAMGLWGLVVMHEPIKDSDGCPDLLSAGRSGDGRWLCADYGGPARRWGRGSGFAFAVSQVSPQR